MHGPTPLLRQGHVQLPVVARARSHARTSAAALTLASRLLPLFTEQIMAIATLSLCYNNHNVFTGALRCAALCWSMHEDAARDLLPRHAQRAAGNAAAQLHAALFCAAGVVKMRRGEVAKVCSLLLPS